MLIVELGRQPEISLAELESVFEKKNIAKFSKQLALINADNINLPNFGGVLKAARVALEEKEAPRDLVKYFSGKILDIYSSSWKEKTKITLGISGYGLDLSSREIQKIGLIIKNKLKRLDTNVRLVPNGDNNPILSTASSLHNKLGKSDNKIELLLCKDYRGEIIIAQSIGVQNITAYAKRDQARPNRDAFVGMLPPKLAQIMLNLAVGADSNNSKKTVLDPFCGTGVILQEAALRDFKVIGTDLNPKMVDYSTKNLVWLEERYLHGKKKIHFSVEQADATDASWKHLGEITAVVCETYLGQPFSAPPSDEKLDKVKKNCNHIITAFLKNIHSQLAPGTKICLAAPAWKAMNNNFVRLPLVKNVEKLGFEKLNDRSLLYCRDDQVVARDILILKTNK